MICARATSAAGQWLAVVPVVCLVQVPFYGMANQNLAVAFFAVAFAMALAERERLTRSAGSSPTRRADDAPVPA